LQHRSGWLLRLGWAPWNKFTAILGPEEAETRAFEAPEPKVEQRPTAEIIDDDIPF
jgi:hypothetical protein